MSRVSASHSGRLGNLKVAGSKLDLAVFKPLLSSTNDFKIDSSCSLACCLALLGYGKDWLAQSQDNASVSGIAGHAASGLDFR